MKRIGIIAGNGQFPLLFSEKAREKGLSVYAAAITGEARPEIETYADYFLWVNPGRLQKMISWFNDHHVEKAVMLGGVDKTRIFGRIEPDMKTVSILSRMSHTHDDALLRAFADALLEEGIEILPSTLLLPDLLAEAGCWTKRHPGPEELADIRLGFGAAKKIGGLDIGQSVVVAGGSIMAVEAIDGTNATIERGAALAKGDCVVVKVSKPGQDLRFDVPAAGADTIRVMHAAGATALAVEAGKTLVFDREEMTALADEYGITVVAVDSGDLPQ